MAGPRIIPKGTKFWDASGPQVLSTPSDIQKAYESGWCGAYFEPEEHEALMAENLALTGFSSIESAAYANGWVGSGAGKLSTPFVHVMEYFPGCWPGPAQTRGDCFAKGTLVHGIDTKPIEEVEVGDLVYASDGSLTKVVSTQEKFSHKPLVRVEATGSLGIEVTADHELLVYRLGTTGGKRNSRSLAERHQNASNKECMSGPAVAYRNREATLVKAADLKNGDYLLAPLSREKESRPDYWLFNTSEGRWVFGRFLADGYAGKTSVEFTFNKNEAEDCERIESYFKSHGLNTAVDEHKGRNAMRLRVFSTKLARKLWASYDDDLLKVFPAWAIGDRDVVEGLLSGDGGRLSDTHRYFDSTSPSLALGIHSSFVEWGVDATISTKHRSKGSYPNARISYHVDINEGKKLKYVWRDENYICYPVTSVTVKEGPHTVYDIGVEHETHVFVANGILAHNCVSHGGKNSGLMSMSCEVAAGKPDEVTGKTEGIPEVPEEGIKQGVFSTEAIYWYRGHNGDGWFCLLPGQMVSGDVAKPIEEVQVGDTVISADGTRTRVKAIKSHTSFKPIAKVDAVGLPGIEVTSDHKVLVYRIGQTNSGRLITPASAVAAQKEFELCQAAAERPSSKVEASSVRYQAFKEREAEWIEAGDLGRGDHLLYPRFREKAAEPSHPLLDSPEGRWLLGYFMGNGWAGSKRRIEISVPRKRPELVAKLVSSLQAIGFSPQVREYSRPSKALRITLGSRVLHDFFKQEVYCGKTKNFPSWAVGDRDVVDGLLAADGYVVQDRGLFSFSSTSYSLIDGVRASFAEWGTATTVKEHSPSRRGRYANAKKLWVLSEVPDSGRVWVDDKYICHPVRGNEMNEGPNTVYDISVECSTESFIANGSIVHNCSAAARVMQKSSGLWIRKNYQEIGLDLTRYDGRLAGKWGSSPPTGKVADQGKMNLVRAFAEAKTAEARRDAIANGYAGFTCGMEGFSNKRDSNGLSQRQGEWAHSMTTIGFDDRPVIKQKYGDSLELILNSWGIWNSGPRDILDSAQFVPADKKDLWIRLDIVNPTTGNIMIPKGSFWARSRDVSRREWLATSSVNGWPKRNLENWGGSLAG